MSKKKTPRATMPARGALVALRAQLEAIPAGEVKPPPIPADRLFGEASALAETAERYEDELAAAGLDRALVGGLATRAQAFAEAQAHLVNVRGLKRSEAEVALEERGTELRSDLIAAGRFALRGNADAQKVLDLVQEGEGLDDLVQDLKTLAVFVDSRASAAPTTPSTARSAPPTTRATGPASSETASAPSPSSRRRGRPPSSSALAPLVGVAWTSPPSRQAARWAKAW